MYPLDVTPSAKRCFALLESSGEVSSNESSSASRFAIFKSTWRFKSTKAGSSGMIPVFSSRLLIVSRKRPVRLGEGTADEYWYERLVPLTGFDARSVDLGYPRDGCSSRHLMDNIKRAMTIIDSPRPRRSCFSRGCLSYTADSGTLTALFLDHGRDFCTVLGCKGDSDTRSAATGKTKERLLP